MKDPIVGLKAGSVAYVFPSVDESIQTDAEPEHGYVQLDSDGLVAVTTLDERDIVAQHLSEERYEALAATTELGGALVLDIVRRGRTSRFGGGGASVRRFHARSALIGVPLHEVQSVRLRSMKAFFHGIGSWAGMSAMTGSVETDDKGRLTSYEVRLKAPPDVSARLTRSADLRVSAHWSTSGPEDKITIHTPVSIEVAARRAQDLHDIRAPLLRFQELVSLAHGRLIVAESGQAWPDGVKGERTRPRLWDRLLMHGSYEESGWYSGAWPIFTMADIGGPRGVARWIRLAQSHPRAMRPVVERFRIGKASAPLRVLELGSGIEYWVNANVRTAKWASEMCPNKKCRCGKTYTLAKHMGKVVEQLLQDAHEWSRIFWVTYGALKHDPSFAADEWDLEVLADSAHLVLAAAILDRAAASRQVSRAMFQRGGYGQLGDRIGRLLASPPRVI